MTIYFYRKSPKNREKTQLQRDKKKKVRETISWAELMAKDNFNKSKETTPTTSTALKVAP